MYIDANLSYASEQAIEIAREGDQAFTLSYIVGCLTDLTEDSLASAIEMAKAYAPNMVYKSKKDKEIEAIEELLKPVGN